MSREIILFCKNTVPFGDTPLFYNLALFDASPQSSVYQNTVAEGLKIIQERRDMIEHLLSKA